MPMERFLGRLAARVATLLMGKHKPIWAPHVDTGDHVVVINAAKVELSGRKLQGKIYRTHSGYIGGLTETRADAMLRLHPERAIEWAVTGMLPKTKLGRAMAKKLKVYRGTSTRIRRSSRRRCRRARRSRDGGGGAVLRDGTAKGTSVARVFLRVGQGRITVNRRPFEDYFPRETLRLIVTQPLELTGTTSQLDAKVNVKGGGLSGQAGAVRHGIARALLEFNTELRTQLKRAGMLTRDPG
jgi:large subunit ribosomal protein L13